MLLCVAKICEPGKAYSPDGCNTCICSLDGTQSACTFKLCLSGLKKAYEDEEADKWGRKYSINIFSVLQIFICIHFFILNNNYSFLLRKIFLK